MGGYDANVVCCHFSGRELFLSDASLFVDDAEAYEKYQREEEPVDAKDNVNPLDLSFQRYTVF